nr:elongation factor 1b [Dictyostelium discoideum]
MLLADLTTENGLVELNKFVSDKTYIVGFVPSSADVQAFNLVKTAPCATKYPHAARWFNTIASYSAAEQGQFEKVTETVTIAAPAAPKADDDVDLFGSDDEDDEEYDRQLEERRKKLWNTKNHRKRHAKSSILLDVKPWDDETDMVELEKCVRSIEMDGLVWGASKLVAVGYGIKKLVINLVVEDLKVSTDELEEKIKDFEDYVQSVDVAAFNKI